MTGPASGPLWHGFVTVLGFEEALNSELALGAAAASGRRRPAGKAAGQAARGPRWPALTTVAAPGPAAPPVDPGFALQQLPALVQVRGDSVTQLAAAAEEAVGPALEAAERPFLVHAYVPDDQAYRTLAGRVELVEQAWLARLRERRRRAARSQLAGDVRQPAGPLPEECLLVQLVLVGRGSLLCSAAAPRALPNGGSDLAPWPGGRAPVVSDRQAPSRAYRKLRESFAWLGQEPAAGERVVDLGGAPGGWAHTALALGAAVIAVDRSPLAPALLPHPRLQMVVGNAFSYRPPAPVDWLLCDVICEPGRTIDLVETWMREGLCRRVVATLKFKGQDHGALALALALARQRLSRVGWPFLRLKHLVHHSNEAVILAWR